MSNKKRWLISLGVIAIVVAVSAVIIVGTRVFPDYSGTPGVAAVTDGSGGVIVAWHEDNSIYSQRIDSSGQLRWGEEGVLVAECPPGSSLSLILTGSSGSGLTLISDDLGGAILTWSDTSGHPDDLDDPAFYEPLPFYCRRIRANGELMWSDSPVSTGKNRQIISDGNGGAVIAWNSYSVYYRGLQDDYLRLQKIAPDGSRLWGEEGILVVASSPFRPLTEEEKAAGIKGTSTRSRPTYMGNHQIVGDDAGGVFVFWDEEIATLDHKVFAQRLDAEGNYVWLERVTVARQPLQSAESYGTGGAIVYTPKGTEYSGIGTVGIPLAVHIGTGGEILESEWYNPDVLTVSDGAGGSFSIRVEEIPPYGDPRERLYIPWIRKLKASGVPIWESEKRALPDNGKKYGNIEYLPDGVGGIVIVWDTLKESVAYSDIRARKLDAAGEVQWSEQGVRVFDIPNIRYQKIDNTINDSSGGAIIVAMLGKSAIRGDMIYIQRLDGNGNRLWEGGIRINR